MRQLLDALRRTDDAVDVRPFLSSIVRPPTAEAPATSRTLTVPRRVPGATWARRMLQTAYEAAFRLRARGFDLYHEPNHIPVRCSVPTVTTIHDLSVLIHPDWHPADRVRWYERDFEAGVRQTVRLLAASEFTKRELVARLGLSPDRIDVTYQAPRPAFRPADTAVVDEARRRLGLPPQFFLFVGTLEPRKNVAGLLAAFAALPPAVRGRHPLVLAGGWGWKMEALRDQIASHDLAGETHLLGYLGDADLAALYTACTALVWPTLYEGFGLPPLEALACGCAVVTSNVASLPEVVGDAGIRLDPYDAPAWTEAMRRVAEDADWRTRWQQAGRARAATFSWSRCARETIACYRAARGK